MPAYPDFVAGQAVRSTLSPDGATLAVITAGQNSLYKADGTVDTPNSTQYVFLYDVRGEHKRSPALLQVLKQTNAHVGLVFAPDGGTLYATGGSDDAVYVYTRSGSSFSSAGSIPLGHYPPGATGNARQKGLGIGVQPNAAGLDVSADGKTLVVANNYNDSITVIDTATRGVRYEHDLRPYFAANEGRAGLPGGSFPFAVVMKGNGVAYVSSDRDREVVAIDVSSPAGGRLIKRIAVEGNALGMVARPGRVQALRRAGQRRSRQRHRHRSQPGGGLDRRAWTIRHAAAPAIYGGGDIRGDDLAGRPDLVCGQQRRQRDCRRAPDRRRRASCQRVDSDRVRAPRRHLQRRRVVDVHRQPARA